MKPFVLIILDGWGIALPSSGNAISLAKTPTIDKLWKKFPHTILKAHGKYAGLLSGQDGNSEAGHMNLGAGRIVEQDCIIISKSIKDKTFFKNTAFKEAIKHIKKYKSKLHIFALLTTSQSAHSNPKYLLSFFDFLKLKKIKRACLHLFTDGRDSPKYSAIKLLKKLKRDLPQEIRISSLMGRSFAMDRGKRWAKTEKAYNAMTLGEGIKLKDVEESILQAYNRGESDEFIQPTIILKKNNVPQGLISDNDAIVFLNLRSDRARQLTKAFVQEYFDGFNRRKTLKNLCFIALTDFGPDLGNILTAFPSRDIENTLPAVLKNYRQVYIAETEKYAHITYFFNGGFANAVGKEERILIPSPPEPFQEKPEMATPLITKTTLGILKKKYHFIALNFANPDIIGHTGNIKAAVKAVECIDNCLNKIIRAVFRRKGTVVITADHGNIEEMINPKTGEINTEHSTNPVPFIVANDHKKRKIRLKQGILSDVAPTILELMKIEKPFQMTRKGLII